MTRQPPGQAQAVAEVVKWFDVEEGSGVMTRRKCPAAVRHFAKIEMPGFRKLAEAQPAHFTFEQPGFPAGRVPVPRLEVRPED